MAHFAELESKTDPTGFTSDTHLIVKQVTVVANDVETAAGPLGENDMHVDGETWCKNFLINQIQNLNKLLTITILENNMQVLDIDMMHLKINF